MNFIRPFRRQTVVQTPFGHLHNISDVRTYTTRVGERSFECFFVSTTFVKPRARASRPQASDQRADGPAEPRPFAAVQHQAATHPRPDHTAPADALLAHIARVRQSRDRGRPHCHTGETHTLTRRFTRSAARDDRTRDPLPGADEFAYSRRPTDSGAPSSIRSNEIKSFIRLLRGGSFKFYTTGLATAVIIVQTPT